MPKISLILAKEPEHLQLIYYTHWHKLVYPYLKFDIPAMFSQFMYWFKEHQHKTRYIHMIGALDSHLIGYTQQIPTIDSVIVEMAIHPAFQNLGYSRPALQELHQNVIKKHGQIPILTYVNPDQARASILAESSGYRINRDEEIIPGDQFVPLIYKQAEIVPQED